MEESNHVEGLKLLVIGAIDRAQHTFWRYRDREFGAQLGLPEEKDHSQAIVETYRRTDE